MEVEIPIRAVPDERKLSSGRLDFDSEFDDFINRDLPNDNRVRRFSNTVVSTATSHRLDYNLDGTINCSDLNYNTLVRFNEKITNV